MLESVSENDIKYLIDLRASKINDYAIILNNFSKYVSTKGNRNFSFSKTILNLG